MKIPSVKMLKQAYRQLQSSQIITSSKLATWSQWSRFDPRLAEQLVFYLHQHWKKLNPIELNGKTLLQSFPSAMGVILEHASQGIPSHEKKLFTVWKNVVTHDFQPANHELFFIGTTGIGSPRMLREAQLPTKAYAKWGYLGQESLWNKARVDHQTSKTKDARISVLNEIIREKGSINVKEYIEKLGGHIHIRQAQRDLSTNPHLKPTGNTRSRIYTTQPTR